jgi:hypothetical protein
MCAPMVCTAILKSSGVAMEFVTGSMVHPHIRLSFTECEISFDCAVETREVAHHLGNVFL